LLAGALSNWKSLYFMFGNNTVEYPFFVGYATCVASEILCPAALRPKETASGWRHGLRILALRRRIKALVGT
jgi:hypothetical protein